MRNFGICVALTAGLTTVATSSLARPRAGAKPATKPAVGGKIASACGIRFLPLSVGNSWTYKSVAAPTALPPAEEKQAPLPSKEIVVTVSAIDAKGADTVVTFDEQIGARKLKTTLSCGTGKVEFSPDAFWFGGEPGGMLGFEFPTFARTGPTWVLTKGTIGETPWREDVKATWKRTPTKDSGAEANSGKLEMERAFTPVQPETLNTPLGMFPAEKLAIQITGRISIDGQAADVKPYELKAGLVNALWLVDNVGVVQVLNSYSHMYVLTATVIAGVKNEAPAAPPVPPVTPVTPVPPTPTAPPAPRK
jgi:hypothetical protein